MIVSHMVAASQSGLRLDVIARELTNISRQAVQKAIKSGKCQINGFVVCKPDYKLLAGEEILLEIEPASSELMQEDGHTEIIWEDDRMAVCHKPAGLTVHPCPSAPSNTLLQRLLSRYPQLRRQGGLRPGIVHRLDKDTSGLMLIALTEEARLALVELFSRHKIYKEYLCLVKGKPDVFGVIDKPLGRHMTHRVKMSVIEEKKGGKAAKTIWQRLAYFSVNNFSLLKVRILTGRTHQIRAHLSSEGYPLLGDATYSPKSVAAMGPRQMLHAARLSFFHPFNSQLLDFYLPPPEDFMECIVKNAKETLLIVVTGNPGSGKSAFCKFLAESDLPYISADAIVSSLYDRQGAVSEWIARNMSNKIFDDDGQINRNRLLIALNSSKRLKREFESYAHQLVFEQIKEFWQSHQNKQSAAILAEIPLYFECDAQERFETRPFVIGVRCEEQIRKERLKNSRHWDDAKIDLINGWQWQEERKMQACQLVVDNQGTEEELKQKAIEVKNMLERLCCEKEQILRQEIFELLRQPGEKLGQIDY